ncbi:FkbM family methyltransferase [Leptolyngbya sp. FACHB-16]|uniref:FkbM family methyltransferase n=1 Tax=unclassified Leptolyngbya TaxID=2650499 RepID=UPI001689D95D|nr:FkbM family methyltransferase [Leptolyngbya sp. FACHB-16]MBD2156178.1 FkbM family methyltransferase [Leptolyngbya sp. FACHB-16]
MIVADFIQIFRNTRYLSGKKSIGLPSNIIAKEYFNLSIKLLLNNSPGSKIDNRLPILGYEIEYLELRTLKYLFEEIFSKQNYYFYTEKEDPIVIDCGSNIGMSILYFKQIYPKSKIIGFEPSKVEFEILANNIKNNHLRDVEVFNLGLAEDEGIRPLFYNSNRSGSLSMSLLEERFQGNETCSTAIETTCLSRYINSEVDFLKLDIEGAELAVLKELDEKKKLPLIKEMVIEYHHHIKQDHDTLSTVFSILESNGFGYQVSAYIDGPFKKQKFQDMLVFAYRKNE